APRYPHGRGSDDKGEATCLQLDYQRCSHWQLPKELLGNHRHHSPLGLTLVEVVDGLVDAATHVAETVGGADDGLTVQVKQVTVNDLDCRDAGKVVVEPVSDVRVQIANADAQGIRRNLPEWFECRHASPAEPPQ